MKVYWNAIILAYLSLFVYGFLDNVRNPFFPDILREFQVNDILGSYFLLLPAIVGFLVSFFYPVLIDHLISPFKALRFGNAFCFLSIFIASLAHNFTLLLLSSFLFGIGFGIVNIAENFSIERGSSLELKRRLFSGLHSNYAFASLCAALLVMLSSSYHWDWKETFQITSGLVFVIFLISLFMKDPFPKPNNKEKIKLKSLFSLPSFYYGFILILYLTGEVSIGSRIVLYLERTFEMPLSDSNMYFMGFFFCLLLGRLYFTFFKIATSSYKVLIISLLSSSLCYFLGLIYSPVWLALCGLTLGPFFGFFMDFLTSIFKSKVNIYLPGTLAVGTIGISTLHFILGALTEYYGIQTALYLGPISLALGTFLLFYSKKVFKDGF